MPFFQRSRQPEFSAAESQKIIEVERGEPDAWEKVETGRYNSSTSFCQRRHRSTSKITQQLKLAGNYKEGSMSDACVGLAGTLLTDISRGTYNLQHMVNCQTNPVQELGPLGCNYIKYNHSGPNC